MKSRVGLCALGLLVLVGALGCGDDKPGDAVKQAAAPTGVTATAGDGQAAVSWTGPTDNGGSAITGYTVQALTNGAVAKSVKSTSTSTTVTGLTNGKAYTFTVAATNSVGDSPFSAPSSAVTPYSVPGAPHDIVATPGNQQVALSWQAPEGMDMPITGYSVVIKQGETELPRQQATSTSATITGLTNGKAYTFTVTATNAVVAGPVSAPVVATPRTTPGAPQVTASPVYSVPNQVQVTWSLDDDGGNTVTGYTVTVRSGETVVKTLESTEKSLRVDSLPSFKLYSFTVVATNEAGDGQVSAPASATPYEFSGPPQNLSCTASVGEEPAFVDCSWKPPLYDGGWPVFGYLVTLHDSPPDRSSYLPVAEFRTTDLHLRMDSLKNGYRYMVYVAAETESGLWTEATRENLTPYTVPSKVTQLTAQPKDGAVVLDWETPFEGGRFVHTWHITVEPGGQKITQSYLDATAAEITGLTNGTTYTFTLVGENVAGFSEPAEIQATPVGPK
ncbi:fibronectin type III domain-containing protein [Pyxidicoccus parkwayensis]|uniref:Fibronectin type III domain-containing protein n=1 Tax=Pyxidicoccus parkwayensis TaxID=2813578 RepID=A0ABX7P338_9BACT|nr:fibronectin type III domain-containing protein [Pyxidicoccus parkwaysis]QSQ24894.1 fibronectin type III domain-containing protein [Pyxidicoccus parkwaysis]